MDIAHQKSHQVPDQTAPQDLEFAWYRPEDLHTISTEWADLAQNAAFPNAYYGPDFVLSHLNSVGWSETVHCATVWCVKGGTRRLEALALLYRDDHRWGWPIRTWRCWADKYFAKFEPLLRNESAPAAARALIAGLTENGRHRTILFIRNENWVDEPVNGYPSGPSSLLGKAHLAHGYQRAALFPRADAETYMNTEISKKFRANAMRSMRRLSEMGNLSFKTVSNKQEVDAAVQDLLRLEMSGWKGKQGTALASSAGDMAFGLNALRAGQCPQVLCDVLSLDGQAIAVSANLLCSGWFFGFKSAFDESFKKHSPGAVLHFLGARAILENTSIVAADSTCVAGHPLESVWRDKISCATTIRSIGANLSGARLKYIVQTEALRNSAKSAAKTIYYSASNQKVIATKS